MSAPTIGAINNAPGLSGGFQQIEAFAKNSTLLVSVERFAERMPKRILQKIGAWGLDFFADFSGDGNANGGYSLAFDFSLHQTHGPIAQASGRHEEHRVDFLLLELPCNGFGGPLHQCFNMSLIYVPHQPVESLCRFSYPAGVLGFS